MSAKKNDQAYAVAFAKREAGYGHIIIHVYELFGWSSCTIKISCQTGGDSGRQNRSYSWEHGVANDFSVAPLAVLKRSCTLLTKAAKFMEDERRFLGEPDSFAVYARRILEGMGIHRAYINPRMGGGLTGPVTDLPLFDPSGKNLEFVTKLLELETELIRQG